MKPRHRAFIIAGLFAALPAFGQGTDQPPSTQPPQDTASQQDAGCPCLMMGQGGGGMGYGRGMGGQGMRGCPMADQAHVTLKETSEGAILQFTARDPGDVAEVQRMARMMESCMNARGASQAPTEPPP